MLQKKASITKVGEPKDSKENQPESNMMEVATKLDTSVMGKFESGEIDATETIGLLAMSQLAKLNATGLLNQNQTFGFLKSMAEKKTPNPVQRVEEHQKIDLRMIFQGAIDNNPEALESSLQQAKQRNQEIQDRLNLSEDMMLSSNPTLPKSDNTNMALPQGSSLNEPKSSDESSQAHPSRIPSVKNNELPTNDIGNVNTSEELPEVEPYNSYKSSNLPPSEPMGSPRGEPFELSDIREGGDGSIKRQGWIKK